MTESKRLTGLLILGLALVLSLAGCTVTRNAASTAPLERSAKWALLPVLNHTEAPQAGLRAEVITEALLRAHGIANLTRYPATMNAESLSDPAERRVQQDAQKWAREQGLRYGVQGAVDEWRYKVGVDGEPAVGVVLQVIDLQSGEVLWSAVGAKSGWSREALAAVAQKLIDALLDTARIQ